MFNHNIPPEIEAMIDEVGISYPTLAGKIRIMWSEEKDCQDFFESLLYYKADFDREGFDFGTYMKLNSIVEAYKAAINPKPDIWDDMYGQKQAKRVAPWKTRS